jgi:hypothetical protein
LPTWGAGLLTRRIIWKEEGQRMNLVLRNLDCDSGTWREIVGDRELVSFL